VAPFWSKVSIHLSFLNLRTGFLFSSCKLWPLSVHIGLPDDVVGYLTSGDLVSAVT
jgi:hypothetical protein